MSRSLRHVLLAFGSTTAVVLAALAGTTAGALDRVSLTTAWLCLLFFAAALLIGPAHVRRTGRPLTNHLLRRDLGIWCAITGLVHLGIAFAISMTPAYMQEVVAAANAWPAATLRRNLYTWAVIGSLVVAAIFVLLLALSSNRALGLLGPVWWKRLQRGSYLAFGLTVAHAVAFQVIEARTAWLVALLCFVVSVVVVAQVRGRLRVRRSPPGASRSA